MNASTPLQAEVASRFGVLPNFFCTAGAAPGLIDELWGFAKSAYLDSGLPSLFKERLFVHLSRFCEVRYCIVRHVGFLVGYGRPAGDAEAAPESIDDVIALLRRPMPDASHLALAFQRLHARGPAAPFPASGTQAETDLFDALTVIFVEPARSARAREAVRAAVGDGAFETLTAYLAFVRTAHFWTETHPEIAYEADMVALMEQRPDLQQLLLSQEDAERVRGSGDLRRILSELQQTEAALRDSEERQRLMVELVPALLWSTSPDGQEVSVNERWLSYSGQTAEETNNFGWLHAVHPDDVPGTLAAFEHAFATGEPLERRHRIYKSGDDWRWHFVRHVPVHDETGAIVRWFGAAVDVHESTLAETALQEAEGRFRILVEGIPQLVWRAVDGGDWTWASPQWTAFTGQSEADSLGHGWLQALHPDDRAAALDSWRDAEASGHLAVEGRLRRAADGRYRWFQSRATPVRDAVGEIVEWLGASTDVEDLRGLQERQRVLLYELQHRVRNTLAVVRSMAASTGRTSDTATDFAAHLEGRLSALARTQMVLTRAAGAGVELESLVREELLAQAARESQLEIGGPEVRLSPKAAEVLALAVHELATNAVKYGALSVPGGRVSVGWSTSRHEGHTWLQLMWRESGVRVVSGGPRREGFGTELIEMRVPYELAGRGALSFPPDGVCCEIAFPLVAGDSILQTDAPV